MTAKMYTAISFAPVQGFIEKSRKLRDLIGASQILSYLSYRLLQSIENPNDIISPGLINFNKGIPNRILLKREYSQEQVKKIILTAWKEVLQECRHYIESGLQEVDYKKYWNSKHWHEAWKHWGNHTWEIFVGHGETSALAMEDLETQKLARSWIALNWIGESSSLSGQDAILYPKIGQAPYLSPNLSKAARQKILDDEQSLIDNFYIDLADLTYQSGQNDGEFTLDQVNKFINLNERLSLPEIVKRLVTRDEIADHLMGMPKLEKGFRDMNRIPDPLEDDSEKLPYRQWTGWFMGDGDKIGDHLKNNLPSDDAVKTFSQAMREWGKKFQQNFPKKLGRVIYAGGDDFFGVIYNSKFTGAEPNGITGIEALNWLMKLKTEWQNHKQAVTFSMGFVWAAPSVPQRDILQHCREAEKLAKSKGRDRVTIRVVFNSGQYVQWTCPWDELWLLTQYSDRQGIQYAGTEQNRDLSQYQTIDGKPSKESPNWGHIYSDLAQLQARRAIDLEQIEAANDEGIETSVALGLFNLYFNGYGDYLSDNRNEITGSQDGKNADLLRWINDLIHIGWQLCDRQTANRPQTASAQEVLSHV